MSRVIDTQITTHDMEVFAITSTTHAAPRLTAKEAVSPPPSLIDTTSTEVNDLSPCSSAASTVAHGHLPASATVPVLAEPDTCSVMTAGREEWQLEVQRAVAYFVGLMAPTTNLKAIRSTQTALLQMLLTLLEKGFTSMEHLICAMALATRLNAAATLPTTPDDSNHFPSMAKQGSFQLLPSTTRRALVGLLRLVAKVHSDVYYSTKDMLTAVDISVTGEMVGMTTRCEWRLFDALGGDMSVSLKEYTVMQQVLAGGKM